MNNILLIILDSARFDNFKLAKTSNMKQIGKVKFRYSYSSWTSPSHYVFLTGIMPHENPKRVFASEVYKKELIFWRERIGLRGFSFKEFVPHLSLPKVMKELGYRTIGRVSLPVLNQFTTFSTYFDDYKLMEKHNDFAGMVEEIKFERYFPSFWFLNLGETHYPYTLPGEDTTKLPRLHGVHGVFKHLDDLLRHKGDKVKPEKSPRFFNKKTLRLLKEKQITCIEYVDKLMGNLFNKCPKNTWIIIASDHGELFGEDDFFGHGPIFHKKVFEVPFIEGKI
jgi:hypothetical protein